MATTFQALMALSATQTKQSQSVVQSQLAQRQRNEEQKRKQAELADKKRREMEDKLRMKHFEEERQRQERAKRAEAEEKARQAALERREEEQRSALRYGPKKAKAVASAASGSSSPKWPSSASQSRTREDVRKRRAPNNDDDDSAPDFLTREEKRERKQQQEMRKLFNPTRRSANAGGGYSKAGKRLPGGAIDVTTTPQMQDSASSNKSVKERITAMPNTLTKLNTVKRDTRTIDEIVQDRARMKDLKTLDGDEAREFNDWFGSSKKKEAARKQPSPSSATSGANTPASREYPLRITPVFLCCILTFLLRRKYLQFDSPAF
jgi:protein SPT2